MNPNGMRAWRRFARSVRRKQNRASRASRALWIADGTGRWYRRQQGFFKQRPSVPARPFTPRSLVGMTQGARKRAAWAEYLTACKESDAGLLVAASLQTWNEVELEAGFQRWHERQNLIRAKYRIGQRLRPCLGCQYCKANPWQMLIAVARLNHLAVKIGRFIPKRDGQMFLCGITVARHCVHFPERNIQVGGGGKDATMHEARQAAAADVLINLRRRYDGLLWAKCDGSGVLPAGAGR